MKNNLNAKPEIEAVQSLYKNISQLIEQSRYRIALAVNQEITLLYWHIGKTINEVLLKNKRAGYGELIVATLSQQLSMNYSKGFTKSNLNRMINFYKKFNDAQKVATLSQQLSWSHFVELLIIEDNLKRDFYVELSKREVWSVRILRQRIASMLF